MISILLDCSILKTGILLLNNKGCIINYYRIRNITSNTNSLFILITKLFLLNKINFFNISCSIIIIDKNQYTSNRIAISIINLIKLILHIPIIVISRLSIFCFICKKDDIIAITDNNILNKFNCQHFIKDKAYNAITKMSSKEILKIKKRLFFCGDSSILKYRISASLRSIKSFSLLKAILNKSDIFKYLSSSKIEFF